jgi:hypothetical protein
LRAPGYRYEKHPVSGRVFLSAVRIGCKAIKGSMLARFDLEACGLIVQAAHSS